MSILSHLHFSHPTQQQKDVLLAMEEFVDEEIADDFFILCGAAGTGKTSITAALIGLLNEQDKPYRIAAPTGRAARILGRKAKTTTSTIHSLIYTPKADSETGRVTFKLKSAHNPNPFVYIIDEASMIPKNIEVSGGLFEVEKGLIFDLISYIKGANVNNKIIFLGDHYQLPPIGDHVSYALNKEFLEQTFNLKGTTHLLTEVKRQEDGSYILENATEIRKAIDENKTQHPIKGKHSRTIYSAADNYVREKKTKGLEEAVAIGVSHKANKFFNDLVRERIFGNAKKILEPGDLLMVTMNWQRNGITLYNGDHVELQSVDWSIQEQVAGLHFVAVKIRLLFAEEETVVEDYALLESVMFPGGIIDAKLENELRRQRYVKNKKYRETNMPSDDRYVGALRLMYGHSITCNKAQGGEWRKVFINTLGIPSLKWQYTAVTRGIDEIETF
jgi:exodeoxyribonuclease-5